MNKKIIIPVKWMHCKSCEIILEKNISKIEGINWVTANFKKWTIEIEAVDNIDKNLIEKEIKKSWYNIWNNEVLPLLSKESDDYFVVFSIAIVFVMLYFFLKLSWFNLDGLLTTSGSQWLVAFLTWIWAGFSSCMALVGWIVLALTAKRNEKNHHLKIWERFVPHIYFNIGRVIWFAFFGWLLWSIWWFFQLSSNIIWILTIFTALIMLYFGLGLIWLFPRLSRSNITLPKFLWKNINSNHNGFMAWILTFFLPCWFTLAMQTYTITSGSFVSGAIIMWAFALWTSFWLLWIWGLSSVFKWEKLELFFKFTWVLLIFLAIYNISNAKNLVNFTKPTNSNTCTIADSNSDCETDKNSETINLTYEKWWLSLKEIRLKKWISYQINIDVKYTLFGCMDTILIPWLDEKIQKVKEWNKLKFFINSNEKWTYEFTCAMWVPHWTKIIIE